MGLHAGGRHKLRRARHISLGHMLTIGLASSILRWTATGELSPELTREETAGGGGAVQDAVIFSKEWLDTFRSGELGFCERAVDRYNWRTEKAGWGSNMNCLIATWVSGNLAGRSEVAVIVGGMLAGIRCLSRSNARVESGWECIYKPMAHLCTFVNEPELDAFIPSREVTEVDRKAAVTSLFKAQAITRTQARSALLAAGSDVDILGASAAILEYINSNIQPWLKEDIESALNEEKIAKLRDSKFVGLHIRRGDKLLHEARMVKASAYLDRAAVIVHQSSSNDSTVSDITGIWLSSDDSSVVSEVRQLASSRFPNVRPENVIWISNRVAVRPPRPNVPGYDEMATTVQGMTYETIVGFFAELKMLSEAEVFVGTFSSNVARHVQLLREINHLARDTTSSVDKPNWFPGRALLHDYTIKSNSYD